MKILIVDDERAIRNSLKEILGDEGYEVDTAENGGMSEQAWNDGIPGRAGDDGGVLSGRQWQFQSFRGWYRKC